MGGHHDYHDHYLPCLALLKAGPKAGRGRSSSGAAPPRVAEAPAARHILSHQTEMVSRPFRITVSYIPTSPHPTTFETSALRWPPHPWSSKDYVAVFVREIDCICYGRVNRVEQGHLRGPGPGVRLPGRGRRCRALAHAVGGRGEAVLNATWIGQAIELARSAPLLVAAAAAPSLSGGAATMSGLASIGATVGAGATVGIVLISAAPAVVGTAGVATLARGAGADRNATMAATGAGFLGGGAGVAAVESTFIGASGSTITSTLAWLGGGSIASGGGGMVAGLFVCAAGPLALCAVTGAAALGAVQLTRERTFYRSIREWEAQGGIFGGDGFPGEEGVAHAEPAIAIPVAVVV